MKSREVESQHFVQVYEVLLSFFFIKQFFFDLWDTAIYRLITFPLMNCSVLFMIFGKLSNGLVFQQYVFWCFLLYDQRRSSILEALLLLCIPLNFTNTLLLFLYCIDKFILTSVIVYKRCLTSFLVNLCILVLRLVLNLTN